MSQKKEIKEIIEILKHDGIGVMPTDTLYGLVGSAFSKKAVNRIYKIKRRNPEKKSIILISSISDFKKFKINLSKKQRAFVKKVWPGKVSIVINNVAFRFPAKKSLVEILKKTGPLVVPSANPEGLKPAQNINEAKEYFEDRVDFYLSGGTLKGKPSALIRLNENGKITILRGNPVVSFCKARSASNKTLQKSTNRV